MSIYARIFAWFGRALISLIFIVTALSQIFYWEEAESDLAYALANWELNTGAMTSIGDVFTSMGSLVPFLLVIAIILQLVGGLFLFFNYRVRLASFLLLVFLVWATLVFQPFWFLEGHALSRSMVLFLNNVAIGGGLIVILAMGKGSKRLERVRVKRSVKHYDEQDDFDED